MLLDVECADCGGFGALDFGGGPWGTGGGGVVDAIVESPNAIRVVFDVIPRAVSAADSDDILNADNWTVTLISPGDGHTPLVQWVQYVNAYEMRVLLDTTADPGALYGLSFSDNVVPASLGVLGCRCAEFVGAGIPSISAGATGGQRRERITDFANPFTERDAQMVGAPLSTFQTSSAGDYKLDSGLVGLRKRIWRRLTTQPGGFYHLPTSYGLAWQEKGLIRSSQLFELQARAQQQALLEPDVIRASAAIRRDVSDPSVVILFLRATSQTGEEVEVGMPFNLTS